MKTKGYLSIIAVIVVLVALIGFLNRPDSSTPSTPPPQKRAAPVDTRRVAVMWPQLIKACTAPPSGFAKARYTLIEVGDFQCPNCGSAEPLIAQMIGSSNGNAQLYFLNYPLEVPHPHALLAAQAGLSAAAQGKFWPMYNLLYSHQDELIPSEIIYNSKSIPGFDWQKLQSDLNTQKYAPAVKQSSDLIMSTGVRSTPTLLLRDPKGKITVYLGTRGDQDYAGIISLAAAPPWGGGMGVQSATALAKAKDDSNE